MDADLLSVRDLSVSFVTEGGVARVLDAVSLSLTGSSPQRANRKPLSVKAKCTIACTVKLKVTASVKTLVSQPSFSFARFQRTQSIGLPVRLDDELRGFIRRVFRQFCEIETRRMCGDVRGHWSSNP